MTTQYGDKVSKVSRIDLEQFDTLQHFGQIIVSSKDSFLKALSDNEDCKVMSRFFHSQLVSYVTSRAASTGSMHEGHVKPERKVNILIIQLGTNNEQVLFLTSHQPIVNAFSMISMHTGKISYAITNYEFNHANHTSET